MHHRPRLPRSTVPRTAATAALCLLAWLACGGRCAPAKAVDASAAPKPGVEKSTFGAMPDGTPVELYTITNAAGMEVKVMTYGATIVTVKIPDRDGKLANVNLVLDTFDEYRRGHPGFGTVIGRFANRIAGAKFTLDGTEYKLAANAGPHHIHGGRAGLQSLVWSAAMRPDRTGVELSHTSPDGNEGYPGTLKVKVVYRLTGKNELRMEYTATTDKPTHLNLTNHAYWNLAGAGSGDVLGHIVTINADRYLAVDGQKIPSGELRSVKGTPLDFNEPKTVGSRLDQVDDRNYDFCYVINKKPGESLALAARVVEPRSGRVMEVYTTQPGVQLYTAKGLGSRWKTGGVPYGSYHGLCLETQHYPDAPNHPEFPSTVLRPGETFQEVTVYKFGVESASTSVPIR